MAADSKLICKVKIKPNHIVRGATTHLVQGEVLPPPSQLEIVQLGSDTGYYLLYLDANGSEMTDTYHESLKSAIDQAEFEFGIAPSEWIMHR